MKFKLKQNGEWHWITGSCFVSLDLDINNAELRFF